MTTEELTSAFNNAGLDTIEKVTAFLKPASISAQLAGYDGKIAELNNRRGEVLTSLQAEEEALVAEREAVRKKLEEK